MQVQLHQKSQIDFTYSDATQRPFRRNFIRAVERVSGQPRLRRLYETYVHGGDRGDFFDTAIEKLDLELVFDRQRLNAVPKDGPVLFIANHPYGVIDGIALTWLARQARRDVKVMANSVLCAAPEAADWLLPVDFAPTKEAMAANIDTRKQAMAALKDGKAIGIFPAGGVAASQKPLWGGAVDPPWHPFVAKMIRKTNATVVPIYFAGQNSRLFQIASHTTYTLRLALFFRETRRMMGRELRVAIGDQINPEELARHDDKHALLSMLRQRTYGLASQTLRKGRRMPRQDGVFEYPARMKI